MRLVLRLYVTFLFASVAVQSSTLATATGFLAIGLTIDTLRALAHKFTHAPRMSLMTGPDRHELLAHYALWLLYFIWTLYVIMFLISVSVAQAHGNFYSATPLGYSYQFLTYCFPFLSIFVNGWIRTASMEGVNQACQFAFAMAIFTTTATILYAAGGCRAASRNMIHFLARKNTIDTVNDARRIIHGYIALSAFFALFWYGIFFLTGCYSGENAPYIWTDRGGRWAFSLAFVGNLCVILNMAALYASLEAFHFLARFSGSLSLNTLSTDPTSENNASDITLPSDWLVSARHWWATVRQIRLSPRDWWAAARQIRSSALHWRAAARQIKLSALHWRRRRVRDQ